MEVWREGSCLEVVREPVEGPTQGSLCPGALGPQGLGSMLATLALPKCGFLRNWEASALAPTAGAHRLGRFWAALAPAPYTEGPEGPEACCLQGPAPLLSQPWT